MARSSSGWPQMHRADRSFRGLWKPRNRLLKTHVVPKRLYLSGLCKASKLWCCLSAVFSRPGGGGALGERQSLPMRPRVLAAWTEELSLVV